MRELYDRLSALFQFAGYLSAVHDHSYNIVLVCGENNFLYDAVIPIDICFMTAAERNAVQ